MSTREVIQRFVTNGIAAHQRILTGAAVAAFGSIRDGSTVTGAPKLPYLTGALYRSWTLRFPDANHAEIETTLLRAQLVEDNVGKPNFRNGGPHGFALTVAGLDRIVALEVEKATAKARAA